jgi:hypothetical protein
MKAYRNRSGDSGVVAYEAGDDSIIVQFAGGKSYLYNHAVTGRRNIERMKQLAAAGKGLGTFISRKVRELYAARLR